MRETPKARQAFANYLAMGPGRSLEKLAAEYQSRTENVPTCQLSRLKRWSTIHGWQARLAEIADEERRAIVARGIAEKQNRIAAANDRWERMRQVINARATDPELRDMPGGKTGLLVRTFKGAGGELVEEFAVDTGLLRELRELEKQTAQELGQWAEKHELTGKDGLPLSAATIIIIPDNGRGDRQ